MRLNDPERLAAIDDTGLAGVPPPEGMQRVVRLVARLLDVSCGLMTLVTAEHQHVVSSFGSESTLRSLHRRSPLSESLCQHVVTSGTPLLITDTATDREHAESAAARRAGVMAYAGVPLRSPRGHLLGSLCAVNDAPRSWVGEDIAALNDLAAIVTDELRLRRLAEENRVLVDRLRKQSLRDDLTGLHNSRFWRERSQVELARARRDRLPASVVMLDVDGFKVVNDTAGHDRGNDILVAIASAWKEIVRPPDLLVRWGGDEFAVMLVGAALPDALAIAKRLQHAARPIVSVSAGVAAWDGAEDAQQLLSRADAQLLASKRNRGGH